MCTIPMRAPVWTVEVHKIAGKSVLPSSSVGGRNETTPTRREGGRNEGRKGKKTANKMVSLAWRRERSVSIPFSSIGRFYRAGGNPGTFLKLPAPFHPHFLSMYLA